MHGSHANRPLRSPDGPGGQPTPPFPQPKPPNAVTNPATQQSTKIQAFTQSLGAKRHEEKWNRTPNTNGTGAIHVRSFHCKLNDDSLAYLDNQINEWLDAHPQYEVKMVQTCVGEWTGKVKEPALIVMVWV